ncbi:hypothetical protein PENTCL1PPCAC_372, partial [Pristionchus entomophagus]
QLAHEWHKFARYSSDLVKQEVRGYDVKLKEAHTRIRRLREENEELRQICLYLDEQRHADSWRSSMTPETDDLTVMEREWEGRERIHQNMAQSTSTMTSSGTTFCSSEMDEMMMMTSSSTVFVDGSEAGGYSHLEVRTLPPIEEERKDDLSQSTTEEKRLSAEVSISALLPPCMEPISSATIGMDRYRVTSRLSDIGMRVEEETNG